MIGRSIKALGLQRDSRCVVHSTISHKDGSEGEFEVTAGRSRWTIRPQRPASPASAGTAWAAGPGAATCDRYCTDLRAATGRAPDVEDWHVWFIDIVQVSWFQVVEEGRHQTEVWRPR